MNKTDKNFLKLIKNCDTIDDFINNNNLTYESIPPGFISYIKRIEHVKKLKDYDENKKEYMYMYNYLNNNDIKISMMTVIAKLNTCINTELLAHYYPERIVVTENNNNKKDRNGFFNQIQFYITPSRTNEPNTKPLKVKVFKNEEGSLQLPGCRNIEDAYDAITQLYDILKKPIIKNNQKIYLIENLEKMEITDVKICMITCNFSINNTINREKLIETLKNENIEYKPPGTHAARKVKYLYGYENLTNDEIRDDIRNEVKVYIKTKFKEEKKTKNQIKNEITEEIEKRIQKLNEQNVTYQKEIKVSLLIFGTGKITITAAKNLDHIIKAHNFIIRFFKEHGFKFFIKI